MDSLIQLLPAAAIGLGGLTNIINVAIGLGLVIFFHELGHFAVAKWCNVYVEKFSIGFGPALLRWKWGETEYALSAVPFGGYVKMLGQDDADPSQLTSEEIAADPRSYSAKPVWQRMAIISAGVIMNLITGTMFCAIAFMVGAESLAPVVGGLEPGKPAWQAGLERGDTITRLNGRRVDTFQDIALGVALSRGTISIEGERRDKTPFKVQVDPDRSGKRPTIGLNWSQNLKLAEFVDKTPPTVPGSPASQAEPPFEANDVIKKIDGQDVASFQSLQDVLYEKADQPITFTVEREGKGAVEIRVQPNYFRTLGMSMDSGPILAIRDNSPAAAAGIKVRDKIIRVNGKAIGNELNPLRMPDEFSHHAGEPVEVVVLRENETGPQTEHTFTLTPEKKPSWLDMPLLKGDPLSVPAIGVAFQVLPFVMSVDADSPAARAGIKPSASIKNLDLIPPEQPVAEGQKPAETIKIALDSEKGTNNWAYAFHLMQQFPTYKVVLTVKEGKEIRTVELAPEVDRTWPLPARGIRTSAHTIVQKADVVTATRMAYEQMRQSVLNIYLTLRSLISGDLSIFELHGPVGIARAAYEVSKQGIPTLLLFLGFLSANLAVINFLPIPVLDGGHMLFLLWEGIFRRKPNEKVLLTATYIGFIFIVSLMLFVIGLDIFVHKGGID